MFNTDVTCEDDIESANRAFVIQLKKITFYKIEYYKELNEKVFIPIFYRQIEHFYRMQIG